MVNVPISWSTPASAPPGFDVVPSKVTAACPDATAATSAGPAVPASIAHPALPSLRVTPAVEAVNDVSPLASRRGTGVASFTTVSEAARWCAASAAASFASSVAMTAFDPPSKAARTVASTSSVRPASAGTRANVASAPRTVTFIGCSTRARTAPETAARTCFSSIPPTATPAMLRPAGVDAGRRAICTATTAPTATTTTARIRSISFPYGRRRATG
ncbi:hypothetical protein GCM10010172_74800 [Paractinoplanes ferrugineus]|uniref:Uncharacterized protein n=1 Tax=Paractinoplanes ferrugineus TaxID=113564 RepID=A0A919IYW1_9ACTN|nr:hypothetical protein [Actinoplanes ferrugineus]GIE11365.1 hypothetical protein Afe05nite_32050 [Actinoplanes ferrugineus]